MQTFDRGDEPAPACLSDERTREARKALLFLFQMDERRQAQTRTSISRLALDDPELDMALSRLFRGRCAFCERSVPTRAYRWRPSEEAGPRDQAPPEERSRAHLYYAWLTNAWRNLYPMCEECFPREASFFPVRGSRSRLPTEAEVEAYVQQPAGDWRGVVLEKPLLLDPCGGADLRKHLAFTPDGAVLALSQSGDATIAQFNLNRSELALSRRRLLKNSFDEFISDGRSIRTGLLDFRSMEHGGAWFLLLYQLARRVGGEGAEGTALSPTSIGRFFERIGEQDDFRRKLTRAWGELAEDPNRIVEKPARPAPLLPGGPLPVRFAIRNFKALEEIDVELSLEVEPLPDGRLLAPALVVLGENAAGKSSLLEAMTLALCDDAERKALRLTSERLMLDPTMMGGKTRARQRSGSVEVTYDDGSRAILHFDEKGIRRAVSDVGRASLGRVPVFAYGAYRLFLKNGIPRGAAKRVRSLFNAGDPLANPDNWLFSIRGKPLFDEVVRALRAILSIGQAFETIEADERTGRCLLVIRADRPDGTAVLTRIPLALVSSGFRAVLGTACDVMRNLESNAGDTKTTLAKSRAVILIDEVEAHLHPRWKMRIVSGLREALPNALFIVTTHDPLCLRGMGAGEVRVLRRRIREDARADELPTVVEQMEELPSIGTLTIEQLLTSDLFQLFSTDDDAVESGLAGVSDLLATEGAGRLETEAKDRLADVRQRIRQDITKALPIGSTEVEQLVQSAVEDYLRERSRTAAASLGSLRETTRARIVDALRRA